MNSADWLMPTVLYLLDFYRGALPHNVCCVSLSGLPYTAALVLSSQKIIKCIVVTPAEICCQATWAKPLDIKLLFQSIEDRGPSLFISRAPPESIC